MRLWWCYELDNLYIIYQIFYLFEKLQLKLEILYTTEIKSIYCR